MTSFLLISAVVIWGMSFVATKICLRYLSPAEIIAARLILVLPIMLTMIKIKGLSFRFLTHFWKPAVGCGLILVAHLLIQVEGMKTTTATNTVWLITTIPVFIVVFAFVFLRERITVRQGAGMAIAAAGVLVLVSRGDLGSLDFIKSYGDWLVLASCLTWTFYTVLGKKITDSPPLAVTTVILGVAAVVVVPPVMIASGPAKYLALPTEAVISLLYLGIFAFALAYWFWIEALSRKTAGQVGAYLYFEPLSTMIVAPLVLGEAVTSSLVLGGILVILGVWLVERRQNRLWGWLVRRGTA
jgi:drug/metabolite transporter (DMT)-like permease